MGKTKSAKTKGSKAGTTASIDESIDRLPTEHGLSLCSDHVEHGHGEASRKSDASLMMNSQNMLYSSVYSTDGHGTAKDGLNTDRFRALHPQGSSTARESYYDTMPRVEYVDLNGRLLDPEKLRSSSLLPGQNNMGLASQYISPHLQPEQEPYYDPAPQSPASVYTPEKPCFQGTYREGLTYAVNIGQDIQEKYAVLPSELVQVRSLFMPISSSRQQSSYDQHHHLTNSNSTAKYAMGDTYEGHANFPASYRIVEGRGRTLVSDLLLDPITGAPVPIQMSGQ